MSQGGRFEGPRLLLFALPAVAALSLLPLTAGGAGDERMHAFLRWTARLSGVLLLLPFTAAPLHRLLRGGATRFLLRNRRQLGLTFAFAHLWHLAAVLWYLADPGEPVEPATLVLGGLGFASTAALAATSNDASQRALGRGWRRLHLAGSYYLWAVMTFTALGVAGAERPGSAILLTLLLAGLVTRIAGRRRRAASEAALPAAPGTTPAAPRPAAAARSS